MNLTIGLTLGLLANSFFACICMAAAATGAAAAPSRPSPALSGMITGVDEGGRILSIKDRGGEQHTIELPAGAQVIRAIDLARVEVGDRIYAILGEVDGEVLVRRAIINGDRPGQKKTEPESSRIWGEVVKMDEAAREISIKTKGGKVKTVGVGRRVRINAFVGLDDLTPGDSVVLIAQGPFDPAKIRTVIVNSVRLGKL